MGGVVASNTTVNATLIWLITSFLETGYVLKLFKNDITPVPNYNVGDFEQATYGGYANVTLDSSKWGSIFKVVDGEYQSDSIDFSYESTGSPTNTVYGFWVEDEDGNDWVLAGKFPAAVVMAPGAKFVLNISPQTWALSIIS